MHFQILGTRTFKYNTYIQVQKSTSTSTYTIVEGTRTFKYNTYIQVQKSTSTSTYTIVG